MYIKCSFLGQNPPLKLGQGALLYFGLISSNKDLIYLYLDLKECSHYIASGLILSSDIVEQAHENSRSSRRTENEFKALVHLALRSCMAERRQTHVNETDGVNAT